MFGYEAIVAGSRFTSRIEIDGGDEMLSDVVREAFDGHVIRLGRSKGTEFGRARCTLTPANTEDVEAVRHHCTFFAESDIALVDRHGVPTLVPEAWHFGLGKDSSRKDWVLDTDHTYLRSRRFALWNTKRGARDLERQTISKGSVIVFRCSNDTPATPSRRVGVGRAEGLGRVVINPPYLPNGKLSFSVRQEQSTSLPVVPRVPPLEKGDEFGDWVSARHEEKEFDATAAAVAAGWAKKWNSAGENVSPSQWGRLDEIAGAASTVADLKNTLGNGHPDTRERKTIFGHGSWLKRERLVTDLLSVLGQEPQLGDRLKLAAFRDATRRMAAEGRRTRK